MIFGGEHGKDRSFLQHTVRDHRQQILVLHRVLHFRKKTRKALFQNRQEARRIAPEVHGNQRIGVQRHSVCLSAVFGLHNVPGLADPDQIAPGQSADPPGHAAVIRKRIAHLISHQRIGLRMLGHNRSSFLKCALPVVIIRIDHRKGAVNEASADQHRVPRSPGLFALRRPFLVREIRHIGQFLKRVLDLHAQLLADRLDPIPDNGFEVPLNVVPDDKNDGGESRGDGVMDAVIDDNMAVMIDRLQLFYSTSKSGTYTRR